MTAFRVIPVLDLRGGVVVRARAGQRETYAPIRTPLASTSAPAAVARGLLGRVASDVLYVADLDAIVSGRPPDRASLEAIRAACPGVVLWVDAGFARLPDVARFRAEGLGRPVLGSESLTDPDLPRAPGLDAVLSLDVRGAQRLGPDALHDDPGLWPDDVIVMSLARVGAGAGPDLEAVARACRARPQARIHAAGGVRGPQDVAALRGVGAAGCLVASAVHDGHLNDGHLSDGHFSGAPSPGG